MPIRISGSTGISGLDGSATTPVLQGASANSGIYYSGNTVFVSTSGTNAMTIGPTGNVAFANSSVSIGGQNISSTTGRRNRIHNGDMRIDQRFAGAAFGTSLSGYGIDRWNIVQTVSGKFNGGQNYNSITPPAGFKNYLGFASQSSYSPSSGDQFGIQQWIEGYNIADFDFGTSNAKTVTLSFWVRCSLTGSFSGAIAGYDGSNFRTYSFSYTINSANTWEYKTITIPGDTTTFSYNSTNSYGLLIAIDLGSGTTYKASSPNTWAAASTYRGVTGSVNVIGTSGATFYITGMQLEIGSAATPFEFIPFTTELQICQRYYEKSYEIGTVPGTATTTGQQIGIGNDINDIAVPGDFKEIKRAPPTMVMYNPNSGATGTMYDFTNGVTYTPSSLTASSRGMSTLTLAGSTGTAHGFVFQWTASADI